MSVKKPGVIKKKKKNSITAGTRQAQEKVTNEDGRLKRLRRRTRSVEADATQK